MNKVKVSWRQYILQCHDSSASNLQAKSSPKQQAKWTAKWSYATEAILQGAPKECVVKHSAGWGLNKKANWYNVNIYTLLHQLEQSNEWEKTAGNGLTSTIYGKHPLPSLLILSYLNAHTNRKKMGI